MRIKSIDRTNFSFWQSKIDEKITENGSGDPFEYNYHHNRQNGHILELIMDLDYVLEAYYRYFILKRETAFNVVFPEMQE